MKKDVSVPRVINAAQKEKNTIINLNAVNLITNGRMNVGMMPLGVLNNSKSVQKNTGNITTKFLENGVLRMRNIRLNGIVQM